MAIHAFIDTTVLRADPRREKGAFVVVARLAKQSVLRLHLSEVTRREFLSQQDAICAKIVRELRQLVRQPISNPLSASVSSLLNSLPESFVETGFDAWLKDIGAEIHDVGDGHGKLVPKQAKLSR
jgi:hypothetical protein